MLGTIVAYVTVEPPDGILPCDGLGYLRADYPWLYAALDPEFIDDGDHFHTPDLRGVFLLGASATHEAFTEGGAEAVALSIAEMPTHSHDSPPHGHAAIPHEHTTLPHEHGEGTAIASVASVLPPPDVIPSAVPSVGVTLPAGVTVLAGNANVADAAVTLDSVGGGAAHENMPPYLAVKYGIVAR